MSLSLDAACLPASQPRRHLPVGRLHAANSHVHVHITSSQVQWWSYTHTERRDVPDGCTTTAVHAQRKAASLGHVLMGQTWLICIHVSTPHNLLCTTIGCRHRWPRRNRPHSTHACTRLGSTTPGAAAARSLLDSVLRRACRCCATVTGAPADPAPFNPSRPSSWLG